MKCASFLWDFRTNEVYHEGRNPVKELFWCHCEQPKAVTSAPAAHRRCGAGEQSPGLLGDYLLFLPKLAVARIVGVQQARVDLRAEAIAMLPPQVSCQVGGIGV